MGRYGRKYERDIGGTMINNDLSKRYVYAVSSQLPRKMQGEVEYD